MFCVVIIITVKTKLKIKRKILIMGKIQAIESNSIMKSAGSNGCLNRYEKNQFISISYFGCRKNTFLAHLMISIIPFSPECLSETHLIIFLTAGAWKVITEIHLIITVKISLYY